MDRKHTRGIRQNDGLETGIMGATAARLAWVGFTVAGRACAAVDMDVMTKNTPSVNVLQSASLCSPEVGRTQGHTLLLRHCCWLPCVFVL